MSRLLTRDLPVVISTKECFVPAIPELCYRMWISGIQQFVPWMHNVVVIVTHQHYVLPNSQ